MQFVLDGFHIIEQEVYECECASDHSEPALHQRGNGCCRVYLQVLRRAVFALEHIDFLHFITDAAYAFASGRLVSRSQLQHVDQGASLRLEIVSVKHYRRFLARGTCVQDADLFFVIAKSHFLLAFIIIFQEGNFVYIN